MGMACGEGHVKAAQAQFACGPQIESWAALMNTQMLQSAAHPWGGSENKRMESSSGDFQIFFGLQLGSSHIQAFRKCVDHASQTPCWSVLCACAGQPKAKPDRKEARKQRQSRRKANQQDPDKALDTTAPTPEQLAAVGAGTPAPVFRRPKPAKKGPGTCPPCLLDGCDKPQLGLES